MQKMKFEVLGCLNVMTCQVATGLYEPVAIRTKTGNQGVRRPAGPAPALH
jgi:hypothetical protein